MPKVNEYVFSIRTPTGIQDALKRICKQTGVSYGWKVDGGMTFHDVRRTCKTLMARCGIQKEVRDTILGHSLQGMDFIYIAPDEDTLRESMRTYTKWLLDQLKDLDQALDQNTIL